MPTCSPWCTKPWPTKATWIGDSNRNGDTTMRDAIQMFRVSSRRLLRVLVGLVLFGGPIFAAEDAANTAFPVTITVDTGKSLGELKPIWRFFGADEPNYAYMKHGQKLVRELGELAPKSVFFRAHNLLTSGDGTPALKWGSTGAYREGADGKAIYDEIYTGWAYPPKDYATWAELVFQWVKHCVEKYGRAEVETWYWQVWNEANIGYWRGTPAEFRKLHDYAIDAVRRALPTARVGGPDTAGDGGRFMQDFLEHCLRGKNHATGRIGTPLDFLSFHAKGTTPTFHDGHVRMGIAGQLKTIDIAFARFASFPEFKGKPIVIGESDPDGCAACQGPHLGYRNTTVYSSYTAASFARKHLLAEKHGVNLEGALTWAFEFEDQPYFAGFRAMASNGLTLPVFNVHRMMAKMSGRRIESRSSGDLGVETIIKAGVRVAPDVGALASFDAAKQQIAILV